MFHILPYVVYHIFDAFATLFVKKIYILLSFFNKTKKNASKESSPSPFLHALAPLDTLLHKLTTVEMRGRIFHPKTLAAAFKSFLLVGTIAIPEQDKRKKERNITQMSVRRGDIYYADLSPVIGSEQGGLRPVLIVQNDIGNRYSPTVIAAAITSRMSKAKLPTHIDIYAGEVGLAKDSVILLEQVRTLDKRRLKEKMGHLDDEVMNHVNTAIAISFGLGTPEEDLAARSMMQQINYAHASSTPAAPAASTAHPPQVTAQNEQPTAQG